MADHRQRFAILFDERPPENGADAEHCVVIARHPLYQCEFCFTVYADVRIEPWTKRGESRQNVATAGEIDGGSGGKREDVPVRADLAKHDELARVADGKRPKEHSLGQGKDRRVRADAERERQYGDRGKHRVPAQGTKPITQVASQIGEPGQAPLIASGLHPLGNAAYPDHGRSPRVLPRVGARQLMLGGHFEVQAKFFFDVGVSPARPDRAPQPDDPFAERYQGDVSVSCAFLAEEVTLCLTL